MSALALEASTALAAWRAGAKAVLAAGGSRSNLLVTIQQPCNLNQDWLTARSPHKFASRGDDIRDVANTIFPEKLAARAATRDQLYEMYLERHDRTGRWRRGRHAWGTYFERLVRFPASNVNQLERVINKLRAWPTRSTTGLVFHLSSPAVDAPRTRGGPCWHYGELLWNADGTLDLVAVYRNHDFFNKVLGNYIGLGRLLRFICTAADKNPGRLVCHSVHAYHEGSQASLLAMLSE